MSMNLLSDRFVSNFRVRNNLRKQSSSKQCSCDQFLGMCAIIIGQKIGKKIINNAIGTEKEHEISYNKYSYWTYHTSYFCDKI